MYLFLQIPYSETLNMFSSLSSPSVTYFIDTLFQSTGHVDRAPLPSLVICPPTLIGHWYYEVGKFCNKKDLNPLQYSGPPTVRTRWDEGGVGVYDEGGSVCSGEERESSGGECM